MKTGLDLMNELQRAVAAVPPDEINECSWNEQKGVLISGRDAQSIIDFLKNRNKVMSDFAAQSVREDRESRWISVEDKLPDEGINVLCYNERLNIYEVSHRWRNEFDKYELQEDGLYKKVRGSYEMWSNNDATHWQPLPSPPTNKG